MKISLWHLKSRQKKLRDLTSTRTLTLPQNPKNHYLQLYSTYKPIKQRNCTLYMFSCDVLHWRNMWRSSTKCLVFKIPRMLLNGSCGVSKKGHTHTTTLHPTEEIQKLMLAGFVTSHREQWLNRSVSMISEWSPTESNLSPAIMHNSFTHHNFINYTHGLYQIWTVYYDNLVKLGGLNVRFQIILITCQCHK
jgi:hypothetical protein